ncbi:MAG: GGDEF domain-containing protein [Endomicrobia bacterium]|nr:GGDEF domain-containing protein [Endomicrobiia bacterium]
MYIFVSAANVKIKNENIGFIISLYDITRRKLTENLLYIFSITDSLTGLYNRRYIEELLHDEIEKYKIYGDIFSVVMVDLDNFKDINDNYGHTVGDLILKKLGNILKNSLRTTDMVGRWGGDEFIIIMKGTKLSDALITAESLRKKLENIRLCDDVKITGSFGVVEYTLTQTDKDIIVRVDRCLYEAKKIGKNCICYENNEEIKIFT